MTNSREIAQFDPAINPSLAGGPAFRMLSPTHFPWTCPRVAKCRQLSEDGFAGEDAEFLRQVASQVAIAVENALEYHELSESRQRLAEEQLYLREEIRTEHNF